MLLDEPTSQLDPVAGDELIWLLRRLNEEWGTAVVLAEHRLERCLGHADRVVVLEDGAVACDAPPRAMLEWAAERAPALQTPSARLFVRAGLRPLPAGVKEARATLRSHGLARDPVAIAESAPAAPSTPRRRPWARGEDVRAALRARGVWQEPAGVRAILRGVDLTLAPGERVALMGRNGAGKSTLLRHLSGLQSPDARARRGGRPRRAAAPEPRRLPDPRARRRRGDARGAGRWSGSAASPTATRATSPAASASGSRWRS